MKSKGQLHLVPINCEVLEGWQTFPTFEKEQCWRCGSDTNKKIIQVTHGVSEPYYYCRSCLAVGSANTCQKYIWQPPLQRKGTDVNLLEWEGCLTPEQSVISNHLKEAVEKDIVRLKANQKPINVNNLKSEIYKKYLEITDEFNGSIYK